MLARLRSFLRRLFRRPAPPERGVVIDFGQVGRGRVRVHGVELQNVVRRVSFDVSAGDLVTVHLEVLGPLLLSADAHVVAKVVELETMSA